MDEKLILKMIKYLLEECDDGSFDDDNHKIQNLITVYSCSVEEAERAVKIAR